MGHKVNKLKNKTKLDYEAYEKFFCKLGKHHTKQKSNFLKFMELRKDFCLNSQREREREDQGPLLSSVYHTECSQPAQDIFRGRHSRYI